MRIEGIKQLDQNFYDTIVVRNGEIKVNGKVLDTVTLGKSFSESLRGKSDEEIKNAVIEYFLEYNRINFVSSDFSRMNGSMFYVGSQSGKLLIIDNDEMSEGKAKVLRRYVNDRDSFLYNSCADTYSINTNYGNTSSYTITRDGNLKFNLARESTGIPQYESKFLERFINHIFADEYIRVIQRGNKELEDGVELVSDKKRVIARVLTKDLMKKVEEHNRKCDFVRKENEDALKMQLKMEGF